MELPILFNSVMVRAILAGRKTQTRRAIKLKEFQKSTTRGYDFIFRDDRMLWNDVTLAKALNPPSKHYPFRSPFGQPGDLLWVAEQQGARIWLKVGRVWVERVQDISAFDCFGEGIHGSGAQWATGADDNAAYKSTPRLAFSYLWDSIYAAKGLGWDSNPYVWCCEFERVDK